ncbi:meiotic nuclear division protein 1 homolog isoform X2 [Nymphaea colorata]|uniref:meiotic nuclear division protein 1 homolog isoform X2 n=1 Tax=Nymphaea colorata TaxID=210225 RepID=UPI00214E67FD|nr:meiotic nuclear division protein 1 homolog isoform X2 [Nymphaea colorata]
MSKKRGLSLEEKREHILQIFYESHDFFLVYFWSLPSCAGNQLRNTHYKLEADIKASKKRLAELVELRENLKKGREDSDERNSALEEMKIVERKYNALKDEMELYADNDPATLDAMKSATEIAVSATNRWTDNIFTVQHWCSQNFPQAREQLGHLYGEVGITEDLDYIEPSKV